VRRSDGGGIGTRVEGICRSQRLPDIVIHSCRQGRSRYPINFKLRWDPYTLNNKFVTDTTGMK
jgi:hypothetical protein